MCVKTDAPSEEKRQQHQKELAHKMNEEARERLKGMKSDEGDQRCGKSLVSPVFFGIVVFSDVKFCCFVFDLSVIRGVYLVLPEVFDDQT